MYLLVQSDKIKHVKVFHFECCGPRCPEKGTFYRKCKEKLSNYVKIENDPHSVSSKILLNYYGKKALNV